MYLGNFIKTREKNARKKNFFFIFQLLDDVPHLNLLESSRKNRSVVLHFMTILCQNLSKICRKRKEL